MSEWKTTTIGDVLTLQRGIDITRAEQRPGPIPVVSSGGIGSYHDTAAAKGPGVVIGRKGTLGKTFYLPEDYWPHDTTLWVKDFKGSHPRFVYYFFVNLDVMGLDVGSANPTLNRNHVHPLQVRWPDHCEQVRIADLLGALDDKIAVNDQIASAAERLAQAIFSIHFSGAVASVTAGKELPNEWNLSTFGEVCSVLETGRRPKGGVGGFNEGIPSIGAESITRLAEFDFTKVKYVPEGYFAGMRQGIVEDYDILLYKDGGRPGNFEPHVSMFGHGFPFGRMCINEHVYRIRLKEPMSQAYGYFWLTSDQIMAEMRSRGTGVAIPGLNSSAVRDLPVVCPSADRLERFDDRVFPLIDRALSSASESKALSQLRDVLLPRLMSGEIRVRNAEKVVEDVT
jgi:type I restriction enzyme, S subunit